MVELGAGGWTGAALQSRVVRVEADCFLAMSRALSQHIDVRTRAREQNSNIKSLSDHSDLISGQRTKTIYIKTKEQFTASEPSLQSLRRLSVPTVAPDLVSEELSTSHGTKNDLCSLGTFYKQIVRAHV